MEPEPGNELEVEGVLNPAAVRGRDGELYLFPRLVAKGNYSRIGRFRVKFDAGGDPVGVERMGIALEPEEDFEKRPGGGGCEDPRVTFVRPMDKFLMTYTALSPHGPRIAMAVSDDLSKWERLGLAEFRPYHHEEFDGIDNKDSGVFGRAVRDPFDQVCLAIIHRPLFPGTRPEETVKKRGSRTINSHKESIWISYHPVGTAHSKDPERDWKIGEFHSHHRLASPVSGWEQLKVGCGAPPVGCRHGWLVLYHGVSLMPNQGPEAHKYRYSAGVMVLDPDQPNKIIYRSPKPILTPENEYETAGAVANVVFPTGIDRRTDIDQPNRYDFYYGMADSRIGVARLDVPAELPDDSISGHRDDA